MNGIMTRNGARARCRRTGSLRRHRSPRSEAPARPVPTTRSAKVRINIPVPGCRISIASAVCRISPRCELPALIRTLPGRHPGYKGDFKKHLAAHEPKALELFQKIEDLKLSGNS